MAWQVAGLPAGEPAAVYAGVGKSGLFRGEEFASVEREEIKAAVEARRARLVLATDAACEGLKLQTLGTLINMALPWNTFRLEQRLGRIKRFGQSRRSVDMLNLVCGRSGPVRKRWAENPLEGEQRALKRFDIIASYEGEFAESGLDNVRLDKKAAGRH